jgi:hypothetical protein
MLRTSTRVGVRKIYFQGQRSPQAGIEVLQNIPADTYIWELNGVLSSDIVSPPAISLIEAHVCQNLPPGPRFLAGPAQFVNHCCRANAKLMPIYGHAIYVIMTTQPLMKGEELTVDYGHEYWSLEPCLCTTCIKEGIGNVYG